MGLRQRNAARTGALLVESALALFEERGYDATTMEQVAERADVSASTLYRYFPSKDRLLLDPLAVRGHLASTLRERPHDEPLGVALGHAIRAMVEAPRMGRGIEHRIRVVIASAASLGGALYEEFVIERAQLEEAVAERLGRPAGDVHSAVTARMTTSIIEVVAERVRVRGGGPDLTDDDVLREVADILETLTREPPTLPVLQRG